MGKRICSYCGKEITGYPHVTVWEEGQEKSVGQRFHTKREMLQYYLTREIDKHERN